MTRPIHGMGIGHQVGRFSGTWCLTGDEGPGNGNRTTGFVAWGNGGARVWDQVGHREPNKIQGSIYIIYKAAFCMHARWWRYISTFRPRKLGAVRAQLNWGGTGPLSLPRVATPLAWGAVSPISGFAPSKEKSLQVPPMLLKCGFIYDLHDLSHGSLKTSHSANQAQSGSLWTFQSGWVASLLTSQSATMTQF